MLPSFIWNNQILRNTKPAWVRDRVADSLISSRELFNVQTIGYDVGTVSTLDLDATNDILLVGTTCGNISLQHVSDPTDGTLSSEPVDQHQSHSRNLHRAQWNQAGEQFFSLVDNHCLDLFDANIMRSIERFRLNTRTWWSDWNFNDSKMIAICCSESQVRIVDIREGSSVHSIILKANSGLKTHRASRCLWSKHDISCLFVGDNEGYIHIYDIRQTTRPLICTDKEMGQISGMSFTKSDCSLLTSHGTQNHIVQWEFDKRSLKPLPKQFSKKFPSDHDMTHKIFQDLLEGPPKKTRCELKTSPEPPASSRASLRRRKTRRSNLRPTQESAESLLKCQFYVTENLVFVPAHHGALKSAEVFVNNLKTGELIKIVKSEDIFVPGADAIIGLLPDSLAIYVGGGGRLRVWAMDEDFERKMRERLAAYEREDWGSDVE